MESTNNNNNNDLLSDSCTPSEKKLQYLKKIKADLAEWYAFSQKPQDGEIHESHDDHNGDKTEWVKCSTHELNYTIECSADSVIHKILPGYTWSRTCG